LHFKYKYIILVYEKISRPFGEKMGGLITAIQNLIGNDFIATAIISFFPLIELKGGIVFARGVGYGFFEALGLSYLGSSLAFFPVFLLLIPILNLLKKIKWFNGLVLKIESYISGRAEKALIKKNGNGTNEKAATRIKQLAVFIFVAIPLPLTGIWTGTAIAVFLGLKFREAVFPILLGNLVAGTLISMLAELCIAIWDISVLDYILWVLFALAAVLLIITIIKVAIQKPNENTGKKTEIKVDNTKEKKN